MLGYRFTTFYGFDILIFDFGIVLIECYSLYLILLHKRHWKQRYIDGLQNAPWNVFSKLLTSSLSAVKTAIIQRLNFEPVPFGICLCFSLD